MKKLKLISIIFVLLGGLFAVVKNTPNNLGRTPASFGSLGGSNGNYKANFDESLRFNPTMANAKKILPAKKYDLANERAESLISKSLDEIYPGWDTDITIEDQNTLIRTLILGGIIKSEQEANQLIKHNAALIRNYIQLNHPKVQKKLHEALAAVFPDFDKFEEEKKQQYMFELFYRAKIPDKNLSGPSKLSAQHKSRIEELRFKNNLSKANIGGAYTDNYLMTAMALRYEFDTKILCANNHEAARIDYDVYSNKLKYKNENRYTNKVILTAAGEPNEYRFRGILTYQSQPDFFTYENSKNSSASWVLSAARNLDAKCILKFTLEAAGEGSKKDDVKQSFAVNIDDLSETNDGSLFHEDLTLFPATITNYKNKKVMHPNMACAVGPELLKAIRKGRDKCDLPQGSTIKIPSKAQEATR